MRQRALLVIMLAGSLAAALVAAGCGGNALLDPSSGPIMETAATGPQSTPLATWEPNPPKSEPDTEVFRDIAVKSCLDEAQGQGVSADQAQQYCTCAIDELLKNVTSNELMQIGKAGLSGNDTLPPEVDQKLTDAVMACIDKLTQ